MSSTGGALLAVSSLVSGYYKIRVLNGVNLEIRRGELVGIIGPNGAGKTTTLRTIAGVVHPWSGSVSLDGSQIAGLPPYRIAKMGLGYVPDSRELFPSLTFEEHLKLAHSRLSSGEDYRSAVERVLDLFPPLRGRMSQRVGTMSGGEQQMVAIARALISNPKLLMLDEPSTGVAPRIVDNIYDGLKVLKGSMGILLVEQNVQLVFEVADRVYLMDRGSIVKEGTPEELVKDELVRKTYLA
ncbi:MAG TPA: ABC transporter ATP-binding protein [Nitrososphaeria archaeon]|nr:ABC transporter ATP-binding protein [Conexivisphaerales archaeon]HEU16531.1 ABC transporter ATP-binding protein [Nitrososphaeria archaeon]